MDEGLNRGNAETDEGSDDCEPVERKQLSLQKHNQEDGRERNSGSLQGERKRHRDVEHSHHEHRLTDELQ